MTPEILARGRRWRWLAVLLAPPVLFLLAQLRHRAVDALGSVPLRSVRAYDSTALPPSIADSAFVRALSGLTQVALLPGNSIELLTDGTATVARLEQDLGSARQSILFQTYFCEPGMLADRIKRVLIQKASEGVRVFFLRDAFGCGSLAGGWSDSLVAAGVGVGVVRPIHWYSMHRAQHRSHARAVVIDDRIGYTGGFGLADKWLPDDSTQGWRDTAVRFVGPAVAQLAGAFAIAWSETTGTLLVHGATELPPAQSGPPAGLLFTTRQYGTPVPERYLAISLRGARSRAFISNPYFIPNDALVGWLIGAVGRGVDVRVLTAAENIDHKWTRLAARTRYEELLRGGVRIYEYLPSMLHAKTMVVDGQFASVGSLNLDNVSLRINDETTLLMYDTTLGAALDSVFLADLEKADEITMDQFERRPWSEKFQEFFARLVRNFL